MKKYIAFWKMISRFENITKRALLISGAVAAIGFFAAAGLLLAAVILKNDYTTAEILAETIAMCGVKTGGGMALVGLTFELLFLSAGIKKPKTE